MWSYNSDLYLAHHGILGQKWGVRRYQNPDGTLTEAGKARYEKKERRLEYKEASRSLRKAMPHYKNSLREAGKEFKRQKKQGQIEGYSEASLKEKQRIGREFIQKKLEAKYGSEEAKALAARYAYEEKMSAGDDGGASIGALAAVGILAGLGGSTLPALLIGGTASSLIGAGTGRMVGASVAKDEYKKAVNDYIDYKKRNG